ncbi:hypothetical protein COO91_03428 [Nostoc flagelliforme CCNUN1]|uniref:Uncharacterized protein n=1 Tax=Nostoc flagelliforme CCNUN1 TaxID=2038116 RepID=A0A2K8SQA5_9NOSO|nr:hypothetical protein COO91_03428 [Nostoc flagelliforme CCNUN1]
MEWQHSPRLYLPAEPRMFPYLGISVLNTDLGAIVPSKILT